MKTSLFHKKTRPALPPVCAGVGSKSRTKGVMGNYSDSKRASTRVSKYLMPLKSRHWPPGQWHRKTLRFRWAMAPLGRVWLLSSRAKWRPKPKPCLGGLSTSSFHCNIQILQNEVHRGVSQLAFAAGRGPSSCVTSLGNLPRLVRREVKAQDRQCGRAAAARATRLPARNTSPRCPVVQYTICSHMVCIVLTETAATVCIHLENRQHRKEGYGSLQDWCFSRCESLITQGGLPLGRKMIFVLTPWNDTLGYCRTLEGLFNRNIKAIFIASLLSFLIPFHVFCSQCVFPKELLTWANHLSSVREAAPARTEMMARVPMPASCHEGKGTNFALTQRLTIHI